MTMMVRIEDSDDYGPHTDRRVRLSFYSCPFFFVPRSSCRLNCLLATYRIPSTWYHARYRTHTLWGESGVYGAFFPRLGGGTHNENEVGGSGIISSRYIRRRIARRLHPTSRRENHLGKSFVGVCYMCTYCVRTWGCILHVHYTTVRVLPYLEMNTGTNTYYISLVHSIQVFHWSR